MYIQLFWGGGGGGVGVGHKHTIIQIHVGIFLRKSAQHNLVHRTVIPAKHQF